MPHRASTGQYLSPRHASPRSLPGSSSRVCSHAESKSASVTKFVTGHPSPRPHTLYSPSSSRSLHSLRWAGWGGTACATCGETHGIVHPPRTLATSTLSQLHSPQATSAGSRTARSSSPTPASRVFPPPPRRSSRPLTSTAMGGCILDNHPLLPLAHCLLTNHPPLSHQVHHDERNVASRSE